jgi:hypothetical protein
VSYLVRLYDVPTLLSGHFMIQFNLSLNAMKDMGSLAGPKYEPNPGAIQWYLHRVTINRKKVVIAMEGRSRYAMIFAGMKKKDFNDFPSMFVHRLVSEVVSICNLNDEAPDKLISLVTVIAEEMHFQKGSDPSVSAHIRQVSAELDWMIQDIGRLPESTEEEFGAGVKVNSMPRKTAQDKGYFVPIEMFQDFWMGMLEHLLKKEAEASIKNDVPRKPKANNVIPFPTRNKASS